MDCLVVVAHPLPESLSHHFAGHCAGLLRAAGHAVTLSDLHADEFDPRLSPAERAAYYASPHQHDGIAAHARALVAAETLVICFPTWWFGPPALLKGWIDRVFAPGVAFDHGAGFGPIQPRLTRLRHVVVVTTTGSPWWVDRLVMRRPVKRVLKTAVFGACAPQARFRFLALHSAEQPAPAAIRRFEARIAAALPR